MKQRKAEAVLGRVGVARRGQDTGDNAGWSVGPPQNPQQAVLLHLPQCKVTDLSVKPPTASALCVEGCPAAQPGVVNSESESTGSGPADESGTREGGGTAWRGSP